MNDSEDSSNPTSIEDGDAELDCKIEQQTGRSKRKRKIIAVVAATLILVGIAVAIALQSNFSWRIMSSGDENFDKGSGVVDEDELGDGDTLSDKNSGIDGPAIGVGKDKQAFESWRKRHKFPRPGKNNNIHFPNSVHGKGDTSNSTHLPNTASQNQNENENNQKETQSTQNNTSNEDGSVDLSQQSHISSNSTWSAEGPNYEVIEVLHHDRASFTQGLTYHDGKLYESTGLKGRSKLRRLNPTTGRVEVSYDLDGNLFGEGLTYNSVDDTLIQITWKAGKGFIYDSETFEVIKEFEFTTTRNEGWGITQDTSTSELIVSDGSSFLHFWNPESLQEIRKVEVKREDGTAVNNLNELEFISGRVFSNIWHKDEIIAIDPHTGLIRESYDFSELWPKSKRPRGTDVLNGISITDVQNELFITGKLWERLYRVRIKMPVSG